MEPVTQAEDSAFQLELNPLMGGQQARPHHGLPNPSDVLQREVPSHIYV